MSFSDRPFYWHSIRKYIVVFASLFSDINIQRLNEVGSVDKTIKVPISYAGKRKMFYLKNRNAESKNIVSTVLPRLAFLITGMGYDPTRKTNPTNTLSVAVGDDYEEFIPAGTPYNFKISMSAFAKNLDDLFQIIEQVCVFFQPDYTVTMDEIKELNIKRDVSINLDDVNFSIDAEYDTGSDRTCIADFEFTLKGMLYKPIYNENIIKQINLNFNDLEDEDKKFAALLIDEDLNVTIDEVLQ